MKLAIETVKELKTLSSSQMMIVHDLIVSLKRQEPNNKKGPIVRDIFKRSQRAFAGYNGSFSDDILAMREDRI